MPCPPHPREIVDVAEHAERVKKTLRDQLQALRAHAKATLAFWGQEDELGRALRALLRRPPRKNAQLEVRLCKTRTILSQMASERRFPVSLRQGQRREMAFHTVHRRGERAEVLRALTNEAKRLKRRHEEIETELQRVRSLSIAELRRDRECLLPGKR